MEQGKVVELDPNREKGEAKASPDNPEVSASNEGTTADATEAPVPKPQARVPYCDPPIAADEVVEALR